MTRATIPTLELNNRVRIPALGLGVFQTPPTIPEMPSGPHSMRGTGTRCGLRLTC